MAFGDSSRDSKLTAFGQATLKSRYVQPGESCQDVFLRVAKCFGSNREHSDRLYDYMSNLWFMPATPILANGGTKQGLPISCYLNSVDDTMESILNSFTEMAWLSCRGGGIGTYYGGVREIGAPVKGVAGAAEGVVPWMTIQNSYTRAVNQANVRGASSALYLEIDHPEIEEFLEIRKPTGGDPDRKALHCHNGVIVSDKFMAMLEDQEAEVECVSRFDGVTVVKRINARKLWSKVLQLRMETGEPYIMFQNAVHRGRSPTQTALGQVINHSNLCTEITLFTSESRTAVCCLSSLNLETFDEWKTNLLFIHDVLEFLDNVIQSFVDQTEGLPGFAKARNSAMRERSVGLGVMGFHGFLMSKLVPFESASATAWNNFIFKHINKHAETASINLGAERGPCPDAKEAGLPYRFSTKLAIAPTASISIICGGATPGVEPIPGNVYVHKTDTGSFVTRNPHLQAYVDDYCDSNRMDAGMKDTFQETFWKSVVDNEGSVRDVFWMTKEHKDVFKTAFEIDQHWIIEHAAKRAPLLDQSQSINLFFAADADKKYINSVHTSAWAKGLKTLYYCRSTSVVTARTVGHDSVGVMMRPDECLSCQ